MSLVSKVKRYASIAGLSLALSTSSYGGKIPHQEQTTLYKTTSENSVQVELPHYLSDVPLNENKVDRLISKWKVYNSLTGKYPNKPSGPNFLSSSIKTQANVAGQEVEIIFNGYIKEPNGEIKLYTPSGIEAISDKEFNLVEEDIVKTLETAVDLAYLGHSKVTDKIIESWDIRLKEKGLIKEGDHFRNHLEDKLEDGLTVKDVMYVPVIEKGDFVPKKMVYGNIPALGLAYLNSGLIFYDPKARVWDHIDQAPKILIHELTHKNPKLQGMPHAWEFDAETYASLPILKGQDALTFMRHGYLEDVRKIGKVLFNFDSERAFKESFFSTAGGTFVKREELEKYMDQIDQITSAVFEFSMNKFLPEYYGHFSFWSSVNKELQDGNASFKIMAYSTWEPTLLGDEKVTRRWLEENKLVYRESLKAAIQGLGDQTKNKRGPISANDSNEQINTIIQGLKMSGIDITKYSPEQIQKILDDLQTLGLPVLK